MLLKNLKNHNMMKKLYILIVTFLVSTSMYAQISLNSSTHGYVPGDAYTYYFGDTTGFNPGTGGANKTWTFNSWTIIPNLNTINYIDPATTPFVSSFPTATCATNQEGTYTYYKLGTAGYFVEGIADSLLTMPYPDDEKMFTYPFTFNTNSVDYFSGSVTISGIRAARNGKITSIGDGWGNLTVNGKTYNNVLRAKIFQEMSDYQIVVASGDTAVAIHYKMTSYHWYRANSKEPIINYMEIKMWLGDVSGEPYLVTKEILVDNEVTGINDHRSETMNFSVYPNPGKDAVTIESKFTIPQKLTIEIINSNGQVVYTEDIIAGAGILNHKIDVSTLSQGIYTVKILNNKSFGVRKLILQ
jgi:hypothetical protein